MADYVIRCWRLAQADVERHPFRKRSIRVRGWASRPDPRDGAEELARKMAADEGANLAKLLEDRRKGTPLSRLRKMRIAALKLSKAHFPAGKAQAKALSTGFAPRRGDGPRSSRFEAWLRSKGVSRLWSRRPKPDCRDGWRP